MKKIALTFACLSLFLTVALAQNTSFVANGYVQGVFPVVHKNTAATIVSDPADFQVAGVAAADLGKDIFSITGVKPASASHFIQKPMIVIGTLGKSALIDQLVQNGKLDASGLKGQWEKFIITVVDRPAPNSGRALVIAGSDRRGTAYGVYELSRQLGVSPWSWWADVPVKKSLSLYVKAGTYVFGPPSVQYRGIFINDEDFGMGQWSRKTFDPQTQTMGPKTYARIYELMLRLKANLIWPAMKGPDSFYQVPGNMEMADRYGIIVGTSHHEPLLVNSSLEWDPKVDGPWRYDTNADRIQKRMDKRVSEACRYENVYTIGLRGHADLAMEGGETMDQRVSLMQTIFKDQRDILKKHIDKPIEKIPQSFTAYKEVLEILNNGLQVPDDAMLVWPDDNYGYMHQLNSDKQKKRPGGSGIYYHLNYVGRPMHSMWISAPSPALIWQELNKAYGNGAKRIWVFNVGDIKPYEYLISSCLDMAWNFNYNDSGFSDRYLSSWLDENLGSILGPKVKPLLDMYYQNAFDRKPEFMGWDRTEPSTPVVDTEYSLTNYREADRRQESTSVLSDKVKALWPSVPEDLKPSFYELVYYPIVCADLANKKMLYAQKNRAYALQQRASSGTYAALAQTALDSMNTLTARYNSLLDGKWNLMMRIQPGALVAKPLTLLPNLTENSEMGIDYTGNNPAEGVVYTDALPCFNRLFRETYDISIYNKGKQPFDWKATVSRPWIKLSPSDGLCVQENKLQVSIDWKSVPTGKTQKGKIIISDGKTSRTIDVELFDPQIPADSLNGFFVENNGAISIDAAHYNRKNDLKEYQWQSIDHLGTTGKVMCITRDTLPRISFEWNLDKNAPSLEYDFYTYNRGWFDILSYTLPTQHISLQRGCLYGISIDHQPPKIVDFSTGDRNEEWQRNVQRNFAVKSTRHYVDKPGKHTLKVWLIDTDVCFDKFVIDAGGLKTSYQGPLETILPVN